MGDHHKLDDTLIQLDKRNYQAYKDLYKSYTFDNFTLKIDRVQGDPFAAPSQVRVIVPQAVAKFPQQLYHTRSREVATRDYLARQFAQTAKQFVRHRGTGKSGLMAIAPLGSEVLERTAVLINSEWLEIRFVVGLPAQGRRILGRQAAAMLCSDLPKIVNALLYKSLNTEAIQHHIETIEDADWLRQQLPEHNLVAFVANGAILPRHSGIDSRPLLDAVPFQSPPSLEVELTCPNQGTITGMGIPTGISLIVGVVITVNQLC